MVTVEEVTSREQFTALKPLWESLLEESEESSPFITYDWFRCCLEAYSEGKKLYTLIVKDDSELIGIAPLWQYKDTIRGIPVRKIGFITSPDTPFVDFVFTDSRRNESLEMILHHLNTAGKRTWDVLTLAPWAVESPNYSTLQEILKKRRKKFFTGVAAMTPYIPTQGDWDAFLETQSVRFRKTHRNIINRINKLEKVETQCVQKDTIGTLLNEILSVSKRSWKDKEGIAISSREEARRFFKALTDLAGQRGWLFVWLLKTNGVPIAMEYDLLDDRKVYALRADFDETYRKFSPGSYLEYQIIKHLFEEGYLEYNTGPGLDVYKLQWTDQLKENAALNICNDNLKGCTIQTLEGRLFPFLRRVRNHISGPVE